MRTGVLPIAGDTITPVVAALASEKGTSCGLKSHAGKVYSSAVVPRSRSEALNPQFLFAP
jgi:hypothetical protein